MKSQFRDGVTVGSTYLQAQKYNAKDLKVSDLNEPLVESLIEDLNASIESNPFEGRPFYINIVEEKDLAMPNALKRRLFKTLYRPFPEDNTLVFRIVPKENRVFFCWDLPHHSEMYNILTNFSEFDPEYIYNINRWRNGDLTVFGFFKVSIDNSSIPGYDEKTINSYRQAYIDFVDQKAFSKLDASKEKKNGYFWIPNKQFCDKDITATKK